MSTQLFICGIKDKHICDDKGPVLIGGETPEGEYWCAPDTEENRKRKHCTWGSTSCSICGSTSMERSYFEGDF